jgi:hypothetical protein
MALMGYQPDIYVDVDQELPEKSALAAKERAEMLIKICTCLEENLQKA